MAKAMPCPFCGEAPQVRPDDWRAEGDAWAAITCENDDCAVQPELSNYANLAEHGEKGSAKQKRFALSKWNRLLRLHHTRDKQ